MARKYTAEALKAAEFMTREEYKKIKHMNHTELALYIRNTWERGYYDGLKEAERRAAEDRAIDEPEQVAGKLENADNQGVSEASEGPAEEAEQVNEGGNDGE